MSRTVLILLVVTAVLATVLGSQKCGKNQEWTNCGTACPPTCEKKPMICSDICIRGCQCKRGFLRNRHQECVLPRHCH